MTLLVSALFSLFLVITGAIALFFFGRLSLERIRQRREENAEGDFLKGKVKTSGCVLLTLAAGVLMYYGSHLWVQNVSAAYDKLKGDYQTAVDDRDKNKKALDEATDREGKLKVEVTGLKSDLVSAEEAKRELESNQAREAARRRQAEEAMKEALLLQQKVHFTPEQLKQYNDQVGKVSAINDLLKVIRLSESYWPILTGRSAAARFAIERTDLDPKTAGIFGRGLFVFKAEEFELRAKNDAPLQNDFRMILTQNLCRAVELAITSQVKFVDALYRVAPAFERYMNDATQAALAEATMLRIVLSLRVAKADLLFRGYADGTRSTWSHPLPLNRTKIVAHRIERTQPSDMTYTEGTEAFQVGKVVNSTTVYDNSDLPNLRGDETAQAIDKLAQQCAFRDPALQTLKTGVVNVSVLEGAPFDVLNPIERKSLGFLYIWLDQP